MLLEVKGNIPAGKWDLALISFDLDLCANSEIEIIRFKYKIADYNLMKELSYQK